MGLIFRLNEKKIRHYIHLLQQKFLRNIDICHSLRVHELLRRIQLLGMILLLYLEVIMDIFTYLIECNGNRFPLIFKKSSAITSTRFAGDSFTLVSSSENGLVKIWRKKEYETFALCSTFQHYTEVISAQLHPCGSYIVSVCKDKKWNIWDVTKGNLITTAEETNSFKYTAADFHPDGLLLGVGTEDHLIKLFDYQAASKEVACFSVPHSKVKGDIKDIAFNENGYTMASASADGLRIWDLRKLDCVKHIGLPKHLQRIKFDQTGKYLASGSRALCIYAVKQDYSILREFKALGYGEVKSVCLGNSGCFFATSVEEYCLKVLAPM